MKKFVQSFWGRFLVVLLCSITVVTGIVSGILTVGLATIENKEQYYKNMQKAIAENYAAYLYDQIRMGESNLDKTIADIENFLKDKNFSCSIGKVLAGDTDIAEDEMILYSNLKDSFHWDYAIGIIDDSYVRYDVESVLNALYTEPFIDESLVMKEAIIEGYVFEESTGLFYYKAGTYYFLVSDILISKDGVYYDYRLKNSEAGKKVYYNSYYDITLDTSNYRVWDWVEMGNHRLLMTFEDIEVVNEITMATADNIHRKLYKGVYYQGAGNYINYYIERNKDSYIIRIKLDELTDVENVSNDMFYEWKCLWDNFLANRISVRIVLGFSIFGVLFGMALLIYSANNDKEKMGVLQKIPVGIFSLVIVILEIPLAVLLSEVVIDSFYGYGVIPFDLSLMIAIFDVFSMAILAMVWLQNVIARFKCRSFVRYSEWYYGIKFSKWCREKWKYIWKKFTTPIRGIIELARENMKLFTKGLVIMLVISLVEFGAIRYVSYDTDVFIALFLLEKVVEFLIITFVLLQMQKLQDGSERIAAGDLSQRIDTRKMVWEFKKHGENINKVSDGIALAVEESIKSERFKTELITNVSHDIKTPLTSIINYVDLIKKQEIQDETLQDYVAVLDRQSARLKKLIEDLMEASKASTGNLTVHMEECNIDVLLSQLIGEFEEKLIANQLELIVQKPEHPVRLCTDGRHMWRVLDNLLNNVCKYSLSGTRVYISLEQTKEETTITFKNISKAALNIPSNELMERFVRGDSSRNTEGSGLGLSIAQSLTELMHGSMKLEIDGDLFKVTLKFKVAN